MKNWNLKNDLERTLAKIARSNPLGAVGCDGVGVADDGGLHGGGVTTYLLILPGLGVCGGVALMAG